MCKKILIVDDEVNVLKALKRTFIETEHQIFTCESGIQALEFLKTERIDLIISDMRMPNMDGYEFLSEVKRKYPEVLRIILSGYSDESVVLKALVQNVAKLYVFKPWENEKLIALVNQIFNTDKLLKSNSLLSIVNKVEGLPTKQSNYQEILTCIDSDYDIASISKLIEQDLSITSRLLHIVNSAFYGVKTGSVKQAVSYLGLTNVRNIILSTSIIDSMDLLKLPKTFTSHLWEHSYISSKVLFFIYEVFLNKKLHETCMAAGLLHNIGVIFFLSIFKEEYVKCRRNAENNKKCIVDLEKDTFGASHQEAGGYLLMWWDIPFPIVESALYHHDPLNPNIINKELLYAVHIGEIYASILLGLKSNIYFHEETFDLLGINKETFEEKLYKDFESP